MTTEKIISVMELYKHTLRRYKPVRFGTDSEHVRWMCDETIALAKAGRTEKAFRWLGFVQGVLWSSQWFTLKELKTHSMPDGVEFQKETK